MSSASAMLGGRVRGLGQANGKSQARVAQESGVSRSTIAQMQLGNRGLHAEELGRLAQDLRMKPHPPAAIPDKREDRQDKELLDAQSQDVPEFSNDPVAFKELREYRSAMLFVRGCCH